MTDTVDVTDTVRQTGPKAHLTLYFSGSDIVFSAPLSATPTIQLFLVHKALLAIHSPVF